MTTAIVCTSSVSSDHYLLRLYQLFHSHPKPEIIFFGVSIHLLLIKMVSFVYHSLATQLHTISSPVSIHWWHGLLTAWPCHTADISLPSVIPLAYNTSSWTQVQYKSLRVRTTYPFSSYSCSCLSTTCIATFSTLIRFSQHSMFMLICAPLSRGTVVKDVSP